MVFVINKPKKVYNIPNIYANLIPILVKDEPQNTKYQVLWQTIVANISDYHFTH